MVISVEPGDVDHAQVVLATSDAQDNDSAIRDIDQWAREHGFVRSQEYHLGVRMRQDGRTVRYSACYRLTLDDIRAADADMARIRARLDSMPLTTSSDILLRED